jgi:hypothetical protein
VSESTFASLLQKLLDSTLKERVQPQPSHLFGGGATFSHHLNVESFEGFVWCVQSRLDGRIFDIAS